MSGFNTSDITISKYSDTDRSGVLKLLAHLWKGLEPSECEEKFCWRYENNPNTSTPLIFIAKHRDKIVGIRAAVVQKFIYQQSLINVYSNADTVIHPDYRGKGILKLLNKSLDNSGEIEKSGIFLNLSSNSKTVKANIKNGFIEMDSDRSIALKISFTNAIRYFFSKRTHSAPIQQKSKFNGYSVFFSRKIDGDLLEKIYERNRFSEKCTNQRNSDYLNWRYSYKTDQYRYVHSLKDEELKGYIILKRLSDARYVLEEYSADGLETFTVLIHSAMRILKITVIQTWQVSFQQNDWLKQSHFIKEFNLLNRLLGKKRFPLLVRPVAQMPEDEDFFMHGFDIRKSKNWQLFHADAH